MIQALNKDHQEDLYQVYSDKITRLQMNKDFDRVSYDTFDQFKTHLDKWIKAYDQRQVIRWVISHKESQKLIGCMTLCPSPASLQFFDGTCSTGLLKLDLLSGFNSQDQMRELYSLTNTDIIELFGIEKIITKAIDSDRIYALDQSAYKRLPDYELVSYANYYVSYKW